MKFCLINSLYFPFNLGGAERVVQLIARGLLNCGQTVIVITSQITNQQKEFEEKEGLNIYRVKPRNIYSYLEASNMPDWQRVIWHFFDLFNFITAKKIAGILKKENPDFVFTHNLKSLSYLIPRAINHLGIKHIHTLHDYQLIDPHGSLYRQNHNLTRLPLSLKIYSAICRRLFAQVDLVISPSQYVLNKHLANGFFQKTKQVVLPNPVILPESSINHHSADKVRLLYLGQIEEHKGVRFLIQAFTTYHRDDFELHIVGDGSLLNELRLITSDPRIKFYGRIESEKLTDIFKQVDLTVIPSLWWDNSPTVIYESYAYQIPVLVSDAGGSQELVKPGKTGYIFKSGNQGDFIANLDKIAQNRANLAKFGALGYDFIQKYQLKHYINILLGIVVGL